jgi:hypothetical protein
MLFEAFSIDKVNPTHRLTAEQDINGEYNSASGQLVCRSVVAPNLDMVKRC